MANPAPFHKTRCFEHPYIWSIQKYQTIPCAVAVWATGPEEGATGPEDGATGPEEDRGGEGRFFAI